MTFGDLQSSGSHWCVVPLTCFYSRYKRQKLNQTQPLMTTEKFGNPKGFLCQRVLSYTEVSSVIMWMFFLLAEEAVGKVDFCLLGWHPV